MKVTISENINLKAVASMAKKKRLAMSMNAVMAASSK